MASESAVPFGQQDAATIGTCRDIGPRCRAAASRAHELALPVAVENLYVMEISGALSKVRVLHGFAASAFNHPSADRPARERGKVILRSKATAPWLREHPATRPCAPNRQANGHASFASR